MNVIAEEIKYLQCLATRPGMTAHTTTDVAIGVLARRLQEALDRIDALEAEIYREKKEAKREKEAKRTRK